MSEEDSKYPRLYMLGLVVLSELTGDHPSLGESMEDVLERVEIAFALWIMSLFPEAMLHHGCLIQGVYQVGGLCFNGVVLRPVVVCRFCKDGGADRNLLDGVHDPVPLDRVAMAMAQHELIEHKKSTTGVSRDVKGFDSGAA